MLAAHGLKPSSVQRQSSAKRPPTDVRARSYPQDNSGPLSCSDRSLNHSAMSPGQNVLDIPKPQPDLLPIPHTKSRLCSVALWDEMRERLPPAEIAAGLRDDLIRHILGPLYAALPVSLDPKARWAALYRFQVALAAEGIKNSVFDHESALWAWLGGKPPTSLNVRARAISRRFRAFGGVNIYIAPLNLSQRDIAYVEGVRVVTPLSLAVELAGSIASDADLPRTKIARLITDYPDRVAATFDPSTGHSPEQCDLRPEDVDTMLARCDRFARFGAKRQTLVKRRIREIIADLLTTHPELD